MQELYSTLERRAPKQLELLIEYVQLSHCLSGTPEEVSRTQLLRRSPDGAARLTGMLKKGIFIQYEKQVSRLKPGTATSKAEDIKLTDLQKEAITSIRQEFEEKQVVLLHGVTSSGKTEIYIKLIREMLDSGRQVLYLLPEIALTTHLIHRLQKYFGPEVGVYHSRYDENERVEIWNHVNQQGMAKPGTG
jgi:primosomal protein N' (replication factor Y)